MEKKAPAEPPTYSNVIVKDQDTARILIDSKAFAGRRTMIPVTENHRNYNKNAIINDSVVARAQKVADEYHEKVFKLIDMVDFPDYINNTFLNTLGQILVVQTLDCANKVAYADGVKTRVLTLRGDDVKPTGCMTGGVTEHGDTSILTLIAAMHPRKEEINALSKELDVIVARIKATEAIANQHREMTGRLQVLQRHLAQLKNKVNGSPEGLLRQEIADAEEEIKKAMAENENTSKELKTFTDKMKMLEARKNNDKATQAKRKKELTSELQKLESQASKIKDKADQARRAVMNLEAAVDDIGNTIRKYETEWEAKKKELDELEEKLPGLTVETETANGVQKASMAALTEFKNHQRTLTTRVTKVAKECDLMRKEESKTRGKKEEREKEVVRLYESGKANKKHSESLLRKCEWLADEQVHFNKRGGIYDFDGYSVNRGTAELKETIDRIEAIERTLCMKNVSNLDTCEAKVMDITNKREKLREDFKMLKKTIAVLDRKKVDELVRAHKSVNEDFGKIFTCLLPDASAQLVPPEGKTVCDGLEVKVSFNGVVKDSLHELSGGQRSLVALSLILAMLKFKPAPLYILDEVDAALDLSHTANIGMMIKTHFNKNQFVIVSLKQGMFSNADALFQTHFADGHSSCNLLTGEALLKAKNDTKLAKQAQEMIDAEKAAKKAAKKPTAKKSKPAPEDDDM
ncbi:CRE-MIX-1 protein [Caenorhabditis remanei]|uniref:CRE-MIX-1 protein n=1 Tax=Caenorhabditis remanei TaxID=31234 RepID=E3LFI6_CAERE|nr:CRE-MIX-1 protein [Caenorhabditis remanei]